MMESLRATYKDEEEDEEWSDALDRRLPPPSPRPPPSDAVGAHPSPPRPRGGFPPRPPVLQDAAQQQEGLEMGGESVREGVAVEDAVGGRGFGVVGEERVEERGGLEDRLEEEQKQMGKGRLLPMEGDEEVDEGEEEDEDEQEEGEDDEEDEEGLEEERGGRQPSTPPSTPPPPPSLTKFSPLPVPGPRKLSHGEYYEEEDEEEGEEEGNLDEDDDSSEANGHPPKKKQKSLTCLITPSSATHIASATNLSAAADEAPPPAGSSTAQLDASASTAKKSKKKSNNVWKKSTSRKSKKKGKSGGSNHFVAPEDKVLITPIARFPDKTDDTPDATICLSRVHKAEKVELSEDRLTAGSTKGYRMVRATRGVIEGAWYFEISVVHLGETGHTRLGWTTEKGDLQAPVGYDSNSFGYRDIDGTKIHKALREKYGDEGYAEGDVIGFYINLPDGASFAPKPPNLVWYKGQRYMYSADGKEEPLKVVPDYYANDYPGSEITFFKNGVCQGTAFTDLFGGRYYPAASMYTLPNQPNCEVRFNFGPNFEFFPEDFLGRPIPRPMIEVPHHGYGGKVEGREENDVPEKKQANGASS
ncbi:hypothetical protein Taro_035714 [Colocasia esculenta]|uniref:B30.2/SPRY domain-containing protein n=1 Tax=Colocasia esculenta TaxID=4460 RepID=A0A843WFL8_COLES|nr:hypothetical protein [Colocasia esculenta]